MQFGAPLGFGTSYFKSSFQRLDLGKSLRIVVEAEHTLEMPKLDLFHTLAAAIVGEEEEAIALLPVRSSKLVQLLLQASLQLYQEHWD